MLFRLEELSSSEMDRRRFLKTTAQFAVMALGFTLFRPWPGLRVEAAPRFPLYPFTLGVASGDPLSDGIVLWTRLAPDPLNGGGMPFYRVPVRWEVATDENFRHVVKKGTTYASPEWGHSVHVDVRGLRPGREYWYRFKSGSELSPVGRTKTAPAPHSLQRELVFAFASCQNFEHGYYTAYRRMAEEDLDVVIHLGDYIYENGSGQNTAPGGNVRKHHGRETLTLEAYRNRYAQYRTDPDLQLAHASFPWMVTWDDHEVDNDYAGLIPEDGTSREKFIQRRIAAYQAYYEHMPLRRDSLPVGRHMQIFRRFTFGDLAQFHLLDTRQYRDRQAGGGKWRAPGEEAVSPDRTLLGVEQETWLFRELHHSEARWNILAQQVFFAQRDLKKGSEKLQSMDAWDGYADSRRRVLEYLVQDRVSNPVVLTGDVHANWACDLLADFDHPTSTVVGTEFVGTSISSGGDGSDFRRSARRILDHNPHIHFHNNHRGYVRCRLTPQYWQTDYRVVPYVSRPGAPILTRASFVVENGRPGISQISETSVPTYKGDR